MELTREVLRSLICVPRDELADLAGEIWRIRAALDASGDDPALVSVRFAIRRLERFAARCGLETIDMTGRTYDPGLPVAVLESTGEDRGEDVRITETVRPVMKWRGRVIRHGEVVVERSGNRADGGAS